MVALVKTSSFQQPTQAILVAQSEMSLDKFANFDKIIKVTQFLSLLAVNAVPPSNDSLLQKMYALSNQVAKLSALIPRHSHSSSKVHSTYKVSDSSKTTSKETGWRSLHLKFKNNASKCISLCSFQENSPSNL